MSETPKTIDRAWTRPLVALGVLALLTTLLGMAAADRAGAAGTAEPGVSGAELGAAVDAADRASASRTRRGATKRRRPARPAQPVVRTYVAKTRQRNEPGPFGDNSKPARAVLKVFFNARRIPARVTVLQFAGEAGCRSADRRSRADGSVPGNWRFPRPIPVTVKRIEGVAYRGFSAKGGDGEVSGSFRPGFRSLSLVVERQFTQPGSAIGADLDEVECSVYERMDGNLVTTPKRKGSRGGRTRGGETRGGRTRGGKDRASRRDSRR